MSETKTTKPWWQSVTLWSVLLSAVGLLIRQYGAHVPVLSELWADPSVQALIGDLLASIGLVGVTWGRVRPGAGVKVTARKPKPPLVVSMLMAGVGLVMMGCGPQQIRTDSAISVSKQSAAGLCIIEARVEGTRKCYIHSTHPDGCP